MAIRHPRVQRFESEQLRGTRILFVSLSLFLYLIRESRGSHLEVGEHLSSSSSSSLSLSRLKIIFWRASRLSFDPRFR